MRDWAVGQAGGSCYSRAALSSNDSKTRYNFERLFVGGGWSRGLVVQIHAFRAFMANGGKFEMGNVHLVVIPQPMEEGIEVAHIVTSLPA